MCFCVCLTRGDNKALNSDFNQHENAAIREPPASQDIFIHLTRVYESRVPSNNVWLARPPLVPILTIAVVRKKMKWMIVPPERKG